MRESEVMAMEEAREAVGDYDLGWHDPEPVSYTHLTLPTMYTV